MQQYSHTDIQNIAECRHAKIQNYKNNGIQRCRDTRIQRYSNTARQCKHTEMPPKTEIQPYRHTDIQTYKNTEIQPYKNSEIKRYKDADIQEYKDTAIQTCRNTETHTKTTNANIQTHQIQQCRNIQKKAAMQKKKRSVDMQNQRNR